MVKDRVVTSWLCDLVAKTRVVKDRVVKDRVVKDRVTGGGQQLDIGQAEGVDAHRGHPKIHHRLPTI